MVTVRPATTDDAEGARDVWEEVAGEGEWIGTELPLHPQWADRFRAAVDGPGETWFVAKDDAGGKVVGAIFASASIGIGHVGMAILATHRGQGLGRRLLDTGIAWTRERECHKVTLEVWPHNERARALYRSAGFVDEGYMRRHYRRKNGALWDVVAMGLILDETAPGRPAS